ncbi:hypothetical protein HB364_02705 [Pseudoflavitalea sp. X16]|uniref:hypothetical protein n=1 Tax=Paraflavitalea devenefica TaxID=2716334 RepID=UPI001424962F|nr:hypothetical protein [Paraflavitalea devenefica]NII23974.1 hypothetical protein [Paraflavitalea devenefica]
MKIFIQLIGASVLTGLLSCQKAPLEEPTDLVVSATVVAAGELVTAKVVNPRPGTSYEWYVPDHLDLDAIQDTSKIRVLYARAGLDSIMVTLWQNGTPYASFSKAVQVKGDYFSVPDNLPQNSTQSITGDKLSLIPFFMPDSTLAFVLRTNAAYNCLNSYIVARNTGFGNTIKASFNGIWKTGVCEPGNMRATGVLLTNTYYRDGSWPIEITFGNKIYHGTLTVSDYQLKYEFTWPDDTEVYIHPYSLGHY